MNRERVARELMAVARDLQAAEDWRLYLVSLEKLMDRRKELVESAKIGANRHIQEAAEVARSVVSQLKYEMEHVSDYVYSDVSHNVRHLNLQIPDKIKRFAEGELDDWKRAIRGVEDMVKKLKRIQV